jgi:acyl-CoA synthetase (AMP-forming)/AMP-acid ligase II
LNWADDVASPLECVALRARSEPRREAVRFEGRSLDFGELWAAIEGAASTLVDHGLGFGGRAVLVMPNGLDFVAAYFGAQLAGGVAVPLFPDSGADRIAFIADHCNAEVIVASPDLPPETAREIRDRCERSGRRLAVGLDHRGDDAARNLPLPRADSLAFLQYTSGSTGSPKGVQVGHGDLMTNIRQMVAGFEITPDDVFVSWLPMSHDMGLILMTLTPLLLGARLVLLPTSVASIRRWMAVIAEERGSFTAAPDFAYRIALRTAGSSPGLDLGCLRVALNAAEPVRAKTIADFESHFGLGPTLVPAYGLAEATVGVAGRRPGAPVKTDDRGLVSVGRPFPGVAVTIVGDDGPARVGEIGEIVVEGPAVTRGYFRNPEATADLLTSTGGIRTGDVGYVDADGELTIVGRTKNIIIQAGRTIAPQEIEETVEQLDFVRRCAAVGIDRGGPEGEQAWVLAETARSAEHPAMVVDVVKAVRDRLGRRPGRVYLLQPRTIPLTANGKIRHLQLRRELLDGTLRRDGKIVYPEH